MAARKPHIFQVTAWGPSAPGASDTRRVTIDGYAKMNSSGGPLCVANEYICAKLGGLIGLPLPPGGVVESPTRGQAAWMTLSFSPTPLPPIDPVEVSRSVPILAAEVLVFDAFIANSDRHVGNLAFMSRQRRLEVFDHSHALLGAGAGGIGRLAGLAHQLVVDDASLGNRHCLIDHLRDPNAIMAAVDLVVREVRDTVIRRICQEAAALRVGLTTNEATQLAQLMIIRRDALSSLISSKRTEFKAIPATAWGINP